LHLTFCDPPLASWDDLALVHAPEYLAKLRDGTLTADDIATLDAALKELLAS
jgi:acetoin utilization deacetylase AcuC-like enzyme